MDRRSILKAVEFKNVKEIIYNSAQKYCSNIAFIVKHKKENKTEYEKITYKSFLEEVNRLGTKLYQKGYNKAKRIAIVGRNKYEWALTHVTNLLGNIISIPIDKELQIDELESCLLRSKADAVVFDSKYLSNIEEIKLRGNTNIQEYICMDKIEGYEDIRTLAEEGGKLIEAGNREYIDAQIDNYSMCELLFTSGTTSKAKAVMLSQNNIASNVYGMQLVEDIRSTDVNLAFLPFHHVFGSTCMIVMLAYGVTTAFPDGLKYVGQNLKEYKVSVFVGVPLLVEAIYKKLNQGIEKQGKTETIKKAKKVTNALAKCHIDIRRKIFKQVIDELGGSLRFVISGGAPLDKEVAKGFYELGIKVVQGYGLTETAPVIAAENVKFMKYGSIGFPLKNVELEIVNKDKNGIGEIRVKGPNVMIGYYENEEETKNVLRDGWFYTGDLAYFDEEGYLFLAGREKNMIVLKNGKKVFPEEMEMVINREELVEESIVFGIPDRDNDVKLSVKVVYNKEVAKNKYPGLSKDELEKVMWEKIKEINRTMPPYKYIKNLIFSDDELIKTTTKKVKRKEEINKILSMVAEIKIKI